MSAGDIVAQKVIEEKDIWDNERTARFAVIGLCLFGPCCTVWYRYLDKLVPRLKIPKPYHGFAKMVRTAARFVGNIFLNYAQRTKSRKKNVIK